MSTPASTTARIFVSHSHHDNEWCRQFVGALQAAGWDVWYDEKGLAGGADWVKTIQHELQARELFLLIVTPDSWTSEWVQDEVSLALATRHIIMPILHKDTTLDGFILTRQYVDVRGMDGVSAAAKVDAELRRQFPAPTLPRATVTPAPARIATPAAPRPVAQTPSSVQPAISPDRFPQRLAQLGFTTHKDLAGVEYILPPVVPVPAGEFLMGSDPKRDKDAQPDEQPQQSIWVGAFEIAIHPVTVAEYACFVNAGHAKPRDWDNQLKKPDHPMVYASWYGAFDYAKWLADCTEDRRWRLPTEAEWEKAARGTDGRIYPWGDRFDKARCNARESGILSTTAIGAYASGAADGRSPYGAQDMAGNVQEWISSAYAPDYSRSTVSVERESNGKRMLRGGSWVNYPQYVRAAFRYRYKPDLWGNLRGFRLVRATGG